jgi:MinD-like ATPase involved in chromosome partitioning or flagellar assembly/CheY-like chemotaxis protein
MEQIKVLLIDSDEANREFLSRMLHKKNYEVFHASTGREGLEKAGQDLPTLIVLDPSLPDLSVRELLEGLSQNKRTAHIPCVALSSHSDPEEMQVCLQAGCVEYYVKSGMVMLNLVDSIPKIVLDSQRTSTKSEDGLVLVFLSAKGGTGTSSLCANIGMSIAQNIQSSKVILLDLVLPMGSIAQIVGQEDEGFNLITVSNQSKDDITPDYFSGKCEPIPQWLFSFLPGSPDPATAAKLDIEKIPSIIAALRKNCDYVLVDVGRALSRITLPIIEEADLIILVLGTDLSTVTQTKKLWEYLSGQGVTPDKVFAILNRAVGLEGLTKMEAEKILGIDIKLMVPYMMGNFSLANNQHVPILTKFPLDTASMVLKQAALEMSRQAISSKSAA